MTSELDKSHTTQSKTASCSAHTTTIATCSGGASSEAGGAVAGAASSSSCGVLNKSSLNKRNEDAPNILVYKKVCSTFLMLLFLLHRMTLHKVLTYFSEGGCSLFFLFCFMLSMISLNISNYV